MPGGQSFCTECGAPLAAGIKFCGACGHPVAPEDEVARPTAPLAPASPTLAPAAPAPRRRRRKWPWVVAGLVVLAIIGAVASGNKSSSSSSSSTGTTAGSHSEKEAHEWITEHGLAARRVAVNIDGVEVTVGELQKEETEEKIDELAKTAQEAHNNIDEVRNSFATTNFSGEVEKAAVQVFTSANSLKNAMGALVAYTGTPSPATLAHFTTQYEPAKAEWDEGISTIWQLAHESKAPSLEPSEESSTPSSTTTSAPRPRKSEPLTTLSAYWSDVQQHNFSGAYSYLAPGAVNLDEAEFIASEQRSHIESVHFTGHLTSSTNSTATVEVVSLTTDDSEYGCRMWSGSYTMAEDGGGWRIQHAALSPRPC